MKICGKCGQEKELTEFPTRSKVKGTYSIWCRACTKAYDAKYYKANRTDILARKIKEREARRKANTAYIELFLKENPCVDCGEKDIVVLDFDHVKGKKRENVSQMVFENNLESIKAEIAKCQIRCANCHRRRHHYQRVG